MTIKERGMTTKGSGEGRPEKTTEKESVPLVKFSVMPPRRCRGSHQRPGMLSSLGSHTQ